LLIDCHAHLADYEPTEIPNILNRANAAGVGAIISAGTNIQSSSRCIDLAINYPSIFAGIGIHPSDLENALTDSEINKLYDFAKSNEKVVVMSEIGLDFQSHSPDRKIQYDAFRQQIRIARELNLPIVFHSRNAHSETFRLLKEERGYEVGGVMHYFQGDLSIAKSAIDLGFHISIAKPLLRLEELQKTVKNLPLNSMVIETDCYPQPFKSKRTLWTEPRHLKEIVEKISELKNENIQTMEIILQNNIFNVLGPKICNVVKKFVL
tara:strand:- start:3398 stop:4192 length:795 start_codon:yes stop_codon:yes gene_type:complete